MSKCQRNYSCIFAGQICNFCHFILNQMLETKHCVSCRVLVCTMWMIMGRVCLVACFLLAVEIVMPTVWWTAAIGKTWQLRRRMSSAAEALHMLHTGMLTLEGWSTVSTLSVFLYDTFLCYIFIQFLSICLLVVC